MEIPSFQLESSEWPRLRWAISVSQLLIRDGTWAALIHKLMIYLKIKTDITLPARLYFKALALLALIWGTGEGCSQNWNRSRVCTFQKNASKSPKPAPPAQENNTGAHNIKQEQEIPLISRLLEGAGKGTAFINNTFYLMGQNHKVLTWWNWKKNFPAGMTGKR